MKRAAAFTQLHDSPQWHVSCWKCRVDSISRASSSAPVTFRDRNHAGVLLARALSDFAPKKALVIAIARGGVPVGAAVAAAMHAELDVMVVHKLGVPGHPHIAAGALATSGAANINHRAIGSLGISPIALERALDKERLVLEQRERELRGGRSPQDVTGRTLIVVDDGVATGTTLRTAISALRARGASEIVVAVPVAAQPALASLQTAADQVVCLSVASPLFSIGQFYEDFSPVSDYFAKWLLSQHAARLQVENRHDVPIPVGELRLAGTLTAPDGARGVVVFLHGSGSNRFSPRNAYVARALERAGFATLLVDLLTAEEQAVDREAHQLRNDVGLLGERAVSIVQWLRQSSQARKLPLGIFGANTGAAAAVIAASRLPEQVLAIVARGGRADLAERELRAVRAPTLLIVGGEDHAVLELNCAAALLLQAPHRIEIVPGASPSFGEPGALERVAELAVRFFAEELGKPRSP